MTRRIPSDEIRFSASRSSGAGGQNVNKVNTKITLAWAPGASSALSDAEKKRVLESPLIQQRLNRRGEVIIAVQETRSQEENRELARMKLESIVSRALTVPEKRIRTRPTRGSVERRITEKKHRSKIKGGRGRGRFE